MVNILVVLGAAMVLLIVGAVHFYRQQKERRRKGIDSLVETARSLAAGRRPNLVLASTDEFADLERVLIKMYSSMSRMRQREKAVLDHAAEGICTIDSHMHFVSANHAMEAILQAEDGSLPGSRLSHLLSMECLEKVTSGLDRARQSLESERFRIEVRSEMVTAWSCVFDPDQQVFYCLVQDTTKQVRLEEMKNDFVSMVSHDLRSPLASIELSHEYLLEEPLSEDAIETLKLAQGSVKRLMALINNVLDLDKLESGSMVLNRCYTPLEPLTRSAIESLSLIAKQKLLVVEHSVDTACQSYFDEEKINQVLVNLLSNAYKFAPPRSTVRVSATVEKDCVLVCVEDQGPGIPSDMTEYVFQKFKQVNRGDKFGGTGLGLSICKAIVESHGGEIGVVTGVDPVTGKGSRFWFSLPQI